MTPVVDVRKISINILLNSENGRVREGDSSIISIDVRSTI